VLDLFRLIQYTSAATARALVEALDAPTAQALVDKTIATGRSIGTLHLTLFELRKKTPELAGELERRIGAERLLRLLRANGTVFELFMLIQYTSAATARALVEALDEPTAQALIDKTIATGRSIGTLNFTLRDLRQKAPDLAAELEERVGVARFWQLARGVGTFGNLADLYADMGPSFAAAFLQAGKAITRDEWVEIARKGTFFELAELIARCPPFLADETLRPMIEAAIEATAHELAATSDWYGLNTATAALKKADDGKARTLVLTALALRLDAVCVETLVPGDFSEAVNAVACLTRERPALLPALASRLWQILPPLLRWCDEPKEFVWRARVLFTSLQALEFTKDDVAKIFDYGLAPEKGTLLANATTLNLFLYLWSLYALWFARLRKGSERFLDRVPGGTLKTLLDEAEKRAGQRMPRAENHALLGLSGLLAYLGAKPSIRCLRAIESKLKKPYSATNNLLDSTFVPAYFGLKGLQEGFPQQHILTSLTRQRLIDLADQYETITPAVAHLRSLLEDM